MKQSLRGGISVCTEIEVLTNVLTKRMPSCICNAIPPICKKRITTRDCVIHIYSWVVIGNTIEKDL